MKSLKNQLCYGLLVIAISFSGIQTKAQKAKPNVLFIAVDDLRTELNCYGAEHIKSPNIDKLASQGILFSEAHVQQSICMASRSSIMTGYRPEKHGLYTGESVQRMIPDALTLNKLFEQNGYDISSYGKIYHHGVDHQEQFKGKHVDPMEKWAGRGYYTDEAIEHLKYNEAHPMKGRQHASRGPAYECADVHDTCYIDGYNTKKAIQKLESLKEGNKPFFMAVGFHKPHLPFVAPKKYWDMYPIEDIKQPEVTKPPENATPYTLRSWGELRNYYGMPKQKQAVSPDTTLILRQGYYACISYMDAQLGKILDKLEELDLDKNTIIVLWGDHGYKLGDYGYWCKWSNMHMDTRVPFIISTPQGKKNKTCEAPVEILDVYPTLADLCGLDLPAHLDGKSLKPALKSPNKDFDWEAYSIWPQNRTKYKKVIMGYAVKTKRFNYVEWVQLKTGEVLARDLYDHQNDPLETKNVIGDKKYKKIIKELSKKCAVKRKNTDHTHALNNQ